MAYSPILNPHPILLDKTQFTSATGNTSTAQLASGASFVGTIENTLSHQAISLLIVSEQPLVLTIQGYIDSGGTRLSYNKEEAIPAGRFAKSYIINSNYFRLAVKNVGAIPTTTLNIDAYYGIINPSANTGILEVGNEDLYLIGASAQTAVVNNILQNTSGSVPVDIASYRSFACQVVSTGTGGTYIFEGSNDGTNFQAIPVYNQALIVRVPIVTAITATASQIIYEGSCNFKFIRLRIVTTITGGSIQAFTILSANSLGTTSQVVSNGTAANLLATVSGTVTANIGTGSIAAGTNAIGDVGLQARANATGAASKTHLVSAATTNATIVKASAGRLLGWRISNTNAAYRYVKLHNQTTSPTAGTGVVETIAVPPNGIAHGAIPVGSAFTTGIAFTTVTGAADSDTTAVGAGDLIIDLFWA